MSEVVSLRVKDIDFDQLTIYLKQAKGKKERITVLPVKLRVSLQSLIAGKDKDGFVFASERGGRLTTRTAQKIKNYDW